MKFEITISAKGDGIRADFEGDVLCGKAGESADQRKRATIKGWFEN